MAGKPREESWHAYLDNSGKNKVFVRYVFSADYSGIEEFAVIYLTEYKEKWLEVIRFDAGRQERVNVHQFYNNDSAKICLNYEKTIDTVIHFVEQIERKWILYRAKFFENIFVK